MNNLYMCENCNSLHDIWWEPESYQDTECPICGCQLIEVSDDQH